MHKLTFKLQTLPTSSGCYLMKDYQGKIIYVGKAINLKNRVNSYFKGVHNNKTTRLVRNIDDFEFIVTSSEKEALLLELTLIKKYNPKYNIVFMDDKTYPYIKITNDKYPYLKIVRERKKDTDSKYFGPYPDVRSARDTLDLLNEIYQTRKCNKLPKKECLYFHLRQCLGPCVNNIDEELIKDIKTKVISFLNGNTKEIIKELNNKMINYTNNLEFEKAIKVRDLINAINKTTDKQSVVFDNIKSIDAFNYYEDKGYICIVGLFVNDGKIIDTQNYLVPSYNDCKEEFISFVLQYYQDNKKAKELVLPIEFSNSNINEVLEFKVNYPHYGMKNEILKMTKLNATDYHVANFNRLYRQNEETNEFNKEISSLLNRDINHIEVFDNSNTSGTNNVSGMVVFKDGKPSKKDYRIYKINDQIDDIASMKEVIYRRYFRVLNDGLEMCDLIIVDGGKNQVNAALEIINSLELDILIIGLLKDEKHQTKAIITSDLTTYELDKKSNIYFYLTRIQDEVHRYALNYHQKLRSKNLTKSFLDDISGLKEKRISLLKKHFKSIKAIQGASVEELTKVVPKNIALKIYEKAREL